MACCAVCRGVSGWKASSHHVAPADSYSCGGRCGGPGGDGYVEWSVGCAVPIDLAQELCDRLRREVADGDDAVVAGSSPKG